MLVNIFSIQNQKEKKKINVIKAAMEILTEKIGISTFFSYYVLIENIFENNIEKNIIKNIYIYIFFYVFLLYGFRSKTIILHIQEQMCHFYINRW